MCRSLSEIAKDVIRGYMKEGNEYDRKELVAAIKEKAERKEEMTDGVIAGAVKMLTASGEIVVIARGKYKKGIAGKEQNMQERVTVLFRKFKADLDRMCMVNALNLKESDLQFISKLNEISNNLEASIWTLEDFGKEAGAGEAPAGEEETEPEKGGKEKERKEKKGKREEKGAEEPMKEAV